MILSTPGLVLHTTPYGEAAVVAKVFTRQLGMRSYLVKGVRSQRGRVRQNLLQPLSCVDMVVYDSPKRDLNYIKELSPRRPEPPADAVGNALRFFMTEVLYKALREEEPMPDLFDYVESVSSLLSDPAAQPAVLPLRFLLALTHHLGVEPLDNHSPREPLFDVQEGCFVATPSETTLPPALSAMLHEYLSEPEAQPRGYSSSDRRALLDALIAYCQLHFSGFRNIHSHEILHTILR
ncbi:MAG: recombination protein O N-terminal domain-containing protein [Bacteroidales bacterium]|nr:recombination protein O N-terminal domain-containing protein [Bacteroidales bacterium]